MRFVFLRFALFLSFHILLRVELSSILFFFLTFCFSHAFCGAVPVRMNQICYCVLTTLECHSGNSRMNFICPSSFALRCYVTFYSRSIVNVDCLLVAFVAVLALCIASNWHCTKQRVSYRCNQHIVTLYSIWLLSCLSRIHVLLFFFLTHALCLYFLLSPSIWNTHTVFVLRYLILDWGCSQCVQ